MGQQLCIDSIQDKIERYSRWLAMCAGWQRKEPLKWHMKLNAMKKLKGKINENLDIGYKE